MTTAARHFIEEIASNMSEVNKPLAGIKAVLEDGAALAALGAGDDDQEMIEEAHDMVSGWLAEGRSFL